MTTETTDIKDIKSQAATKVLTLGHCNMGTGEAYPFDAIFDKSMVVTGKTISSGAPIDALVIWGGEDINPELYGEKPSRYMYKDARWYRDDVEVPAVKAAIERGIPLIGVCRGAQLLCALAGGRLIQHVENHGSGHNIITNDGRTVRSNSMHHQMMYPFDIEHEMLAVADPEHRSKVHINQDSVSEPLMRDKPEPEVVFFPKIKGLAIQGHPEFVGNPENPFVQYCLEMTRKYLGV